ncbi:MAG: cupin domain-containing protein [Thermoanaerobaculia bacterium]|nr:cupin domain-containing protein [Thermoanaerobaculia bacterium]
MRGKGNPPAAIDSAPHRAGDIAEQLPELGLAAPLVAPPARLKARLLERFAAESTVEAAEHPEGSFFPKPGVVGVRSAEATWKPTPLPGLEVKLLFRDEEKGISTKLVRFGPGTTYPSHRHGGREEVYVLEGTVWVNGVLLRAGDYCRSEKGTVETGTYSETGGMILSVSSDRDEFGVDPASEGDRTSP